MPKSHYTSARRRVSGRSIGAGSAGVAVCGGAIPTSGSLSAGWIGFENNAVDAGPVPLPNYASGVPGNAGVAGNELGTIAHAANKTGSYRFGTSGVTSGVEANNWSQPAWCTAGSHRLWVRKATGDAAQSMLVCTPGSAQSPTSSLGIECYSAAPFSTSHVVYLTCVNASNHQVQFFFETDLSGFPNARSRFYNGSAWDTPTNCQRQSSAGAFTYARAVIDITDDVNFQMYWNTTRVLDNVGADPTYSANWPGWSTFGPITSVYCTFAENANNTTGYNYAMRALFDQSF